MSTSLPTCAVAWNEPWNAPLAAVSELLFAFLSQFTGISNRDGHIQTTKVLRNTWLTRELGAGRIKFFWLQIIHPTPKYICRSRGLRLLSATLNSLNLVLSHFGYVYTNKWQMNQGHFLVLVALGGLVPLLKLVLPSEQGSILLTGNRPCLFPKDAWEGARWSWRQF